VIVASAGSIRIEATSTSCAVEPLVPPLVPPLEPPMVPLVPPLLVWSSMAVPPKVLPSDPLPHARGTKAAQLTATRRPRVVRMVEDYKAGGYRAACLVAPPSVL